MSKDASDFQRLITKAFTAAAQVVSIASPNQTIQIVQLAGTWTGTLIVEGSNDGVTYYPVIVLNSSNYLPVSSITANGLYIALTNGFEQLRIRASTWSSGTGNASIYGSDAASLLLSLAMLRGGTDGTNIGNRYDALKTGIQGHDGTHTADVFLQDGIRKLQTTATATVESLFGEAVNPFTAIKILTVGVNTNTIRVQIPDDSVDVTTTKTASEVTVNDLAKKVRDNLNANGNFSALYKATTPRDSHEVCMEAKLIQTLRPDSGDVIVTSTGTITFTLVWDTIVDQSLALALFPHPKDCTKGTISVVGEINVLASGRPPKRLLLHDSGASPDMSVNGSVTPVVFKLSNNAAYDNTRDMIVTELRFEATANTMTMGSQKYVGINAITVGHLFQIRSDGNLEYNENMKNLTDIFHAFAFGEGSKFQIQIGSGDDSVVASFARPFFIRKAGTFGTDDDIIVTVRDDLSSTQVVRLQVSAVGFFED